MQHFDMLKCQHAADVIPCNFNRIFLKKWKNHPKIRMKYQKTPVTKATLRKKGKVGGLTLPDFKHITKLQIQNSIASA